MVNVRLDYDTLTVTTTALTKMILENYSEIYKEKVIIIINDVESEISASKEILYEVIISICIVTGIGRITT